jgi:hypothetical protein
MAHVLNLIYSGGTVVLNSGSYRLMDYTPRTGADRDEFVTESAEIEIGGTAYPHVQDNIGAIERVFAQVTRWRDSRVGEPVYVSYQPDGYSAPMTSELHNARLELSPEARKRAQWGVRLPRVLLIWERRNYWQGAKTQLAISNPNGADNTTGLRVYNCNDGAVADTSYLRHNYFTVDGADIGGDLPAPIKLDLAFATPPATVINVYISATHRLPGNHVEETIYGDEIPGASSSGGSYREYPANTGIGRYVLKTTAGQHNFDGYYHILARFPTIPVQPISLMFYDFYRTFRTKTILMPAQVSNPLILVDTVRIRSKTKQFILMADLSVPTGTDVLGIDYVAFLDSEKFVHLIAYGRIGPEHDGDYVWYDNSNALDSHAGWQNLSDPTHVNRYIATYGPGLFLTPGKDHKFALFWDQDQGECDVSAFLIAKLYYYPRRRTL